MMSSPWALILIELNWCHNASCIERKQRCSRGIRCFRVLVRSAFIKLCGRFHSSKSTLWPKCKVMTSALILCVVWPVGGEMNCCAGIYSWKRERFIGGKLRVRAAMLYTSCLYILFIFPVLQGCLCTQTPQCSIRLSPLVLSSYTPVCNRVGWSWTARNLVLEILCY